MEIMDSAGEKAWRFILDYHKSGELRDLKKLIDKMLEEREEFFH
jgi:hypothetical protein